MSRLVFLSTNLSKVCLKLANLLKTNNSKKNYSKSGSINYFKEKFFAAIPVALEKIKWFRIESFPASGPLPWLDCSDAEKKIQLKYEQGILSIEETEYCRQWRQDGLIIIKNLIGHDFLDKAWLAYEASIKAGKISLQPEKVSEQDPYPGRFLNPHRIVPELNDLLAHNDLLKWIKLLLDREPLPYQTIASHKGSQQGVHSDSIHMTTYPLGYLAAAWIAFEDIHPDSGPLVYYPGSHKLPYLFSKDVGIPPGEFQKAGYAIYQKNYEPAIQQLIQENDLKPAFFEAKKGDVLIWHANLLHGGSQRKNIMLSRKAIVCHYFVKGAVCYHDLSGIGETFL